MNLINPNSIEGYVNHFADRLVTLSNSPYSKFHVTFHYPNLLIISGLNTSTKLLNFSKVHSDFLSEFPNYVSLIGTTNVKFIDLTNNSEYTNYETKTETNWFTFYNTPRPLYSEFQINEFISPYHTLPFSEYLHLSENEIYTPKNLRAGKLTQIPIHGGYPLVSSSYPFGYMIDARMIMYTAEFIAYNLFRFTKTDKIQILNTQMSPQFISDEFTVRCKSKHSEQSITSMAIDVLDDYDMFEAVDGYNIGDDLLNPVADKPWLESWKVGEMVIF